MTMKAKRARVNFKGRFDAEGPGTQLGDAPPKMVDYGPTRQATLIVGLKRGHQAINQSGRCARAPAQFTTETADQAFITGRLTQVKEGEFAATRKTGKGWYQGQPEPSAAYEVVFIPNEKEPTYEKFKRNMNKLASIVGGGLCQDSVLVVHDDGDKRRTKAAERK